jgi:UDP-glucose:(heptosyl)LPS alpha-1,3-glucosyltransferase
MKIALVIGRYDAQGGGAERWTDLHARYLLRKGHSVHLVSRSFDSAPAQAMLHRLDVGHRDRLGFASAAEDFLRGQTFDAIHDMGDGWFADVLTPHHGTRIGGFARTARLLPGWLAALRRWAQPLLPRYREFHELEQRQFTGTGVRLLVALSEMIRRDMIVHYGVAPERIRVVPNGVDVDQFHPAQTEEHRLARWRQRSEWGWENRCVFLFVAHNFRLKGLNELLQAVSNVKNQEGRIGLIVAGDGRIREYTRLAHNLGLADDVRFVGNCADTRELYRAADVFVHPTYYDPCSLVLLEAMASGLPIITTKHNGAGELIESECEGYVIDHPTDVPGLVDAMKSLTDSHARFRKGQAARRTACRNTLRGNSERYLDLYRFLHGMRQAA